MANRWYFRPTAHKETRPRDVWGIPLTGREATDRPATGAVVCTRNRVLTNLNLYHDTVFGTFRKGICDRRRCTGTKRPAPMQAGSFLYSPSPKRKDPAFKPGPSLSCLIVIVLRDWSPTRHESPGCRIRPAPPWHLCFPCYCLVLMRDKGTVQEWSPKEFSGRW